jgi:hypothetical protein
MSLAVGKGRVPFDRRPHAGGTVCTMSPSRRRPTSRFQPGMAAVAEPQCLGNSMMHPTRSGHPERIGQGRRARSASVAGTFSHGTNPIRFARLAHPPAGRTRDASCSSLPTPPRKRATGNRRQSRRSLSRRFRSSTPSSRWSARSTAHHPKRACREHPAAAARGLSIYGSRCPPISSHG